MKKDLLKLLDLSGEEIIKILNIADQMKYSQKNGLDHRYLAGKTLAMIFEKNSTRTRVSFEVGIRQLGGFAVHLASPEISIGRRELVRDVAKNLERMVQGIMIRTFDHAIVEELAIESRIPVINGLTDFSHPCQAMADYLTILETRGDLSNVKITYIGDGNNVAHSLIFGAAHFGAHIVVATPAGYEPDASVVSQARTIAEDTGGKIELMRNPVEAAQDADVLYTDVWTSMGQETENEQRQKDFVGYQIDDKIASRAKDDYIFMHCLPAHRGEEVTDEVIDGPQSVVFDEAENRLHAQKGILAWCFDAVG